MENDATVGGHVSDNLKSAVKQLRSEVQNAFSDVVEKSGTDKLNFKNSAAYTSAKYSEQALKLTEYLLHIKENQLGRIKDVCCLSHQSIIELAHLFLDSLYQKPSVQSIIERIIPILHASGAIFWRQTEKGHELKTSMLPITEGERVLLTLLPILAAKNSENVAFEYEGSHYLAHTATNYLDETMAIIFINGYERNYTMEEERLGAVLSEIIFKIAQL